MSLGVFSLSSGIGGLELGLERAGMRTVGQVELDPYCRRVLAKHWPDVPRHDDVRTAAEWWQSEERPTVDVICGGFPCQDISAAGKRAGIIDGEQSSLWNFFAHTVRLLRPRYVLVENVPRVLSRGKDGVIPAEVIAADLATLGYDLRWDCVPAAAVGAPHRRDRWFGIAHAQRNALRLESVTDRRGGGSSVAALDGPQRPLAHPSSITQREPAATPYALPVGGHAWPFPGRGSEPPTMAITEGERRRASGQSGTPEAGPDTLAGSAGERRRADAWATEPDVGRVVNGVPSRLDRAAENERIHALGNAVVPQVAEHIGRLIVEHAERAA